MEIDNINVVKCILEGRLPGLRRNPCLGTQAAKRGFKYRNGAQRESK